MAFPVELLACPRCGGEIDERLVCACGTSYPDLEGIPVVLEDGARAIGRFRRRAADLVDSVGRGVRAARSELARPDLLARTRERVDRSTAALEENLARILRLLAAAGIEPVADGDDDENGSPAGRRGITELYEQIHRDWGWEADGVRETHEAKERSERAAEGHDLGTLVVLGAGACRLAYDLAARATRTVALDINPLPLLVAARLARGEEVELCEFPLVPREVEQVAVLRKLRAPLGPARVDFVLANAFDAPLRDGCADTVLTPWFIDQVPDDAREVMAEAHRLLRPGGRWINHGPLIYPKDRAYAFRYCASELAELVAASGFAIASWQVETIEFLNSPVSGFSRVEEVLTFAADKRSSLADGPVTEPPAWLLAPHLPVPRFAGLDAYAAPHPLLGKVAAMLDGKTSIRAIGRRLMREDRIPREVAKLGVPAAVREIFAACSKG